MVSAENNPMNLGLWTDADLSGTARATIRLGADADLPEEVRFISGVAKLIRRRLAEKGAQKDLNQPAIFLLKQTTHIHKLDITPKRVPMLDNGLTAVTGRLWFVSPVVVTGSYIDLEESDDDKLFRIVTDELKLGNVPAVIFDPRTRNSEIRFYRKGLISTDTCEVMRVNHADVSLERVFAKIHHIYKTFLVTPEAQLLKVGRLWKNNAKWWPSEEAEEKLQLYLRIGLTIAFPMCVVNCEQTSVSGRFDVEIEESDPLDSSRITRHAILELKVLRSFRCSGTPVSENDTFKWIESGVIQAASYCYERKALASALCCFDMRNQNTGEKCFEHVKDLALKLKVELKVWFIYATSKLYRDAMIANL